MFSLNCNCFSRLRERNRQRRNEQDASPPHLSEQERERLEFLENVLPCVMFEGNANKKDEEVKEEDMQCPICLMEYEVNEKLSSSHNPKCRHLFHRACIKKWLLSNHECPCCRNDYLAFSDDEDEDNAPEPRVNLLGTHIPSPVARIGNQIGRLRQGLTDRLEPLFNELANAREFSIDPNNRQRSTDANHKRESN